MTRLSVVPGDCCGGVSVHHQMWNPHPLRPLHSLVYSGRHVFSWYIYLNILDFGGRYIGMPLLNSTGTSTVPGT